MVSERTLRCYWRRWKMVFTRWVRKKTFFFNGRSYRYFYHVYNKTWKNERAVEIPIFWEIVQTYQGKRILEVGNVLSHYFHIQHDVADKYEVAPGVINQDIVDFLPPEKYDLIVSISTLEHVGWDEEPREPRKILRAIENLKTRCLTHGGKIVASLPLGYNPYLDQLLKDGKIPFMRQHYLKRVSKKNYWVEVDWDSVREAKYGRFVANALVIGIIAERPYSDRVGDLEGGSEKRACSTACSTVAARCQVLKCESSSLISFDNFLNMKRDGYIFYNSGIFQHRNQLPSV